MDIIERLFMELATIELRKGAALADAAREAKFKMQEDMPEFMDMLGDVKAASERKIAKAAEKKAKKGKAEPEPEAEIDIDASLEPTAE